MNTLIVTGDRDTFQLISDHVTVLYNSRGVSDMRRYDPAALVEKYGLTPAQYPDFAALRGDNSDNLPGIPGVGEKTATKWITEFGSLEELVNRVDEVKGKAGDALREHLGNVLRNRQLTTLIRDLPESTVGATPADLVPRPWDRETIHQLFDTLQFRVLRDRLYQTFPDGLPGTTPAGAAATAEAWRGSRSRLPFSAPMRSPAGWKSIVLQNVWGLLWQAAGAAARATSTGIALAAPDGTGRVPRPRGADSRRRPRPGAWLASGEHPKALHDAKGPIHALAAHGYVLNDLTSDTALAAYLALPGQRTFDLADLALRYLGKELSDDGGDNLQLTLDGSGEEESARSRWCCGPAPRSTSPPRWTPTWKSAAPPGCSHEIELPLVGGARARWSGPASRPTPSTSRRCPRRCTAR